MLLVLENDNGDTVVKDFLDINFDMSISEEKGRFYVCVNRMYKLPESYPSKEKAIEKMLTIADCRNNLEEELRNF